MAKEYCLVDSDGFVIEHASMIENLSKVNDHSLTLVEYESSTRILVKDKIVAGKHELGVSADAERVLIVKEKEDKELLVTNLKASLKSGKPLSNDQIDLLVSKL